MLNNNSRVNRQRKVVLRCIISGMALALTLSFNSFVHEFIAVNHVSLSSISTPFVNPYFNNQGNRRSDALPPTNEYPVPTVMIIGAQKCATTLFDRLLRDHPMIAIDKVKEKHYFDNITKNELSLEKYTKLFQQADGKSITFDSTPTYILWTNKLPEIKEICPKTKFIVILRDPVERVFSQYNMHVNKGWFKGSFEEFIEYDISNMTKAGLIPNSTDLHFMENVDEGWNIFLRRVRELNKMTVGRGLYSLQLRQWFKYFPRDFFLVLNYHDLKKENGEQNMYDRVTDFIGLPQHDLGLKNITVFEGNYKIAPMNPETKKMLYNIYSVYNEHLTVLLGKEWEGFGKMES